MKGKHLKQYTEENYKLTFYLQKVSLKEKTGEQYHFNNMPVFINFSISYVNILSTRNFAGALSEGHIPKCLYF